MISIRRIAKPRARLIKLIPVEILCRVCRLNNRLDPSVVACLCDKAQSEWHLGEISSSRASIAEAISLAKELNNMHGVAEALFFAACLGHYERNPAEVERLASELIELSTRENFALWLAIGSILRGWVRSA